MIDNNLMSKDKQIDGATLAVLNCYRNKYYADVNNTEQGIVANAINDVLPTLVEFKNGCYRKQKELIEENDRLNLALLATTERSESRKEADISEILELRLKVDELFKENERLIDKQRKEDESNG